MMVVSCTERKRETDAAIQIYHLCAYCQISHLPISFVTFVNIMSSSDFYCQYGVNMIETYLSIQQMAEDVKSLGASFVLF